MKLIIMLFQTLHIRVAKVYYPAGAIVLVNLSSLFLRSTIE